jgi:hypothetical protein
MKKLLFSIMALLAVFSSAYAYDDATATYRAFKVYGVQNDLMFTLLMRSYSSITFTENSDLVWFNSTNSNYHSRDVNWNAIDKIVYVSGSEVPTGVSSVNGDAAKLFRQIGNNLVFSASANLAVFSIDGRMVIANTSVAQGESVSIADLAAGIYVVKTNNTTSKIVKR